MSGGLEVFTSWDGRDEWPAGARGAAEALDVTEDAAESIERLRGGAVGFVSERKGREGGGMAEEALAAVGRALADGVRGADLGGSHGTAAIGDAVLERL